MHPTFRKTIKYILIFCAVSLILNILVNNVYTYRLVSAVVRGQLEKHSYVNLEFKGMSVNFVPFAVTFSDVTVASKLTSDDSRVLLKASSLEVAFSWLSILLDENKVDLIRISDLNFRYDSTFDYDGLVKLDQTPSATKQPFTWPPSSWPLSRFELKNAHVVFGNGTEEIHDDAVYAEFHGLDFSMKFSNYKGISAAVDAKKVFLAHEGGVMLKETTFSGLFRVGEREISASDLQIHGPDVDLSGSAKGDLPIDKKSREVLAINLDTSLHGRADLKILGAFLDLEETEGRVDLDLTSYLTHSLNDKYLKNDFYVRGHCKYDVAMIAGFGLPKGEFDAFVDYNHIALDNFYFHAKDGVAATGIGKISFDKAANFDFDLNFSGMPFVDLMKIFNVDWDVFDADLHSKSVKIVGQFDPFSADIEGPARFANLQKAKDPYDMNKKDLASCEMDMRLHSDADFLEFKKVEGTCVINSDMPENASDLKIAGKVDYNDDKTRIDIKSKALDLAIVNAFLPMDFEGLASIEANVSMLKEISLTKIIARSDGFLVDGIEFLGFDNGEILLKEGVLSWRNLNFNFAKGSQLSSRKGSFNIENEYISGSFHGTNISSDFVHAFLNRISEDNQFRFGISDFNADLSGLLTEPRLYKAKFSGAINQLRYQDESLLDVLKLDCKTTPEALSCSTLHAELYDTSLDVNLNLKKQPGLKPMFPESHLFHTIGLRPNDVIKTNFKTKRLEKVTKDRKTLVSHFPFWHEYFAVIDLKGQFDVVGQLDGPAHALTGDLESRLSRTQVFGSRLPDLKVSSFIENSRVTSIVRNQGSSLEGRLELNFAPKDWEFNWYFNLDNYDLRAFLSPWFYPDPRNYAYLSGNWTLKGKINSWWNSVGSLNIDQVKVKFYSDIENTIKRLEVGSTGKSVVMFDRGHIYYDKGEELNLKGKYGSASFRILDGTAPASVHFQIKASVEAEVLTLLTSAVENASGLVDVLIDFEGPINDLALRVTLNDASPKSPVSLGFAALRPAFNNMHFKIIYEDGKLNIVSFDAQKGAGMLQAAGVIVPFSASQGTKTNVNISFDKLKVIYQVPYLKSFDSVVSGDIQITGVNFPYQVSGDIIIIKASSAHKFDIHEEVIKAMRADSIDVSSHGAITEPRWNFDVQISGDQSILINNNTINGVVSTDLRLQGTEFKPILIGSAQIVKGTFFYKQLFTVTRGELIFDDPAQINPKLDIYATSDVTPYKILVAVSGTSAKPVVDILVDPPTREDGTPINQVDALVLLVTGTLPTANQQSLESSGVGISEAANLYFSQIPLEDMMRYIGQDKVFIFPDFTTNEKGELELQLNATVKIYKNMDLTMKQTPTKSEYSVQVPIHENIRFLGTGTQTQTVDEAGKKEASSDTSVDLKFRFSFN